MTWARAAISSTSAGGHPSSTGISESARARSATPRDTLFVMAERSTLFARFLLARADASARGAELHEDGFKREDRLNVARQSAPRVFDPFERADQPGRIGDGRRTTEAVGDLGVDQRLIGDAGAGEENVSIKRRDVAKRGVVDLGFDPPRFTLVAIFHALACRAGCARIAERFEMLGELFLLALPQGGNRCRCFLRKLGGDAYRLRRAVANEPAWDVEVRAPAFGCGGIFHESKRRRQVAAGARGPGCERWLRGMLLDQNAFDLSRTEREEVHAPATRDNGREQVFGRLGDEDEHDVGGRFFEH